MELISGCERKEDVLALFIQYTESIAKLDPYVRKTLQTQHFGEELQNLEAKYGMPKGRLYLAVVDGNAVGCGALTYNSDEYCEMKRLFVKPEYRGAHIAQQIVDRLIADARAIGYKYMRLDTFPFAEEAIRLYEKNGFRYVGKYNDNPTPHAIYMQKDL